MKVKIECLREPKLAFGFGTTGLKPRRCLAKAGPVDAGKLHEVRLALVGPAADVEAARAWLSRLNSFMPAVEGNSARYPNWPGAPSALGIRFLLEDRFIRPVDAARLLRALIVSHPNPGSLKQAIDVLAGNFVDTLRDHAFETNRSPSTTQAVASSVESCISRWLQLVSGAAQPRANK